MCKAKIGAGSAIALKKSGERVYPRDMSDAFNYLVLATVALVLAVVGVRVNQGWLAGLGFLFFCCFGVMAGLAMAGTWALANLFPNSM